MHIDLVSEYVQSLGYLIGFVEVAQKLEHLNFATKFSNGFLVRILSNVPNIVQVLLDFGIHFSVCFQVNACCQLPQNRYCTIFRIVLYAIALASYFFQD